MPLYRGGSLLVVSPSSSRAAHSATVHQEQRIVTSVSCCSAPNCHAHRGGQEGREAGFNVEKGTLGQLSMRETKSGKTRSEKREKGKEQLVMLIRGWTPNGLFRTTRVKINCYRTWSLSISRVIMREKLKKKYRRKNKWKENERMKREKKNKRERIFMRSYMGLLFLQIKLLCLAKR